MAESMQIFNNLLKLKLVSPHALGVYDKRSNQRFAGFTPSTDTLLDCYVSDSRIEVLALRNAYSGEFTQLAELEKEDFGVTAKNSLSLNRILSSSTAKGIPENLPFWPGGFDLPFSMSDTEISHQVAEGYLSIPPGFSRGLEFTGNLSGKGHSSSTLNYFELLMQSEEFCFEEDDTQVSEQEVMKVTDGNTQNGIEQDVPSSLHLDLSENYGHNVKSSSEIVSEKYCWAVHADLMETNELFKLKVSKPAKMWPFELDLFQKQAIIHIEARENVFVAAHTSAGKTVVAEYAIAQAINHHTKIIYTSPLKALSNQKFRDFRGIFGKERVGIITGDIQVQVSAPCLIMTTEILRSMLYNGSDIIRDVEWVVFDEVHYVNDSERGVVWEETLIMLPEHISVILLSATVPNAMEFADWIGCTKKRLIHVVSTIKRPVPLEHFLYTGFSPKTADQLFKIVNQEGRFVTEGYKQALKAKELHGSKRSFSKSANHERNIWMSLISMLQKQNKLPLVSFTFSRKRCDSNASSLTTLDLTDSAEKNYIHSFFMKCISKLKGSDQTLPQVVNMKELLKRGIAVHHSGILPLLKEIIELLFQKGYVRLLFATETFAMGVNMPARSVVFDSIEKHDGKRKRDLLSSEYIQMAGRAGRRGLDLTGTVIILCKDYEIPESSELHRMILGKPIRLESKFYVTYSMILSLAKVDTLRIEDMLKKSYSEIDSTREVPLKQKELQKVISELSLVREHTTCPPEVDRFYAMCERLKDISMEISHGLFDHPAQRRKVASPGRLLLLATSNGLWEVAILLKIDTAKGTRVLTAMVPCEMGKERLEIDGYQCLQPPDVSTINIWAGPVTIHSPLDWSYSIANVPEECIMGIVDKDFNVEPNKILDDFKKRQIPRFRQNSPSPHCQNVLLQLQSFLTSFPPLLNPVKDLRIHEFDFVHKIKEAEYLREQLREVASKLLKMGSRKDTIVVNPLFMEQFGHAHKKVELLKKQSELTYALSEDSLCLLPEYKSKEKVLKRLGYLSESGVVQHKGKVACNLNTHEVFLTELLYENLFRKFSLEEMIALMSPLVFQQSKCSEPNLTSNLQLGKEKMKEIATRLAELEIECGVDTTVEDYQEEFNWGLVEVVYKWALGMSFSDVIVLTDVHEGIIVRCIQRLNELFKSVKSAARVIGNSDLHDDMVRASELIQRDIIFAASLYIEQ